VLVEGNYIGTDVTGASAMGNRDGVYVEGSGNTIGGTTSGAGNIISANTTDGVFIDFNATRDAVEGNYIGTNAAGSAALANSVGIEVNSSNETIGGTTSGARNVISGNSADGVLINSTASGVAVQGNFIGTDVTGTQALSNNLGIEEDGSNNSIGGSVFSAGNLIADNSQGGVLVKAGSFGVTGGGLVNTGTGDTIRSNSIYANGSTGSGPGITLSDGGNNALAAPSLDSATLNGSSLTVTGSFNSPSANNTYVLEFFANPSSDAEGRVYLGSLAVTSTNTNPQSFTFTTTTTATGTYPLITATLTDDSGDTSSFSSGLTVGAQAAPMVTNNPASQTVTAGQDATFTAYASGNPTPAVQWQFSTDGGQHFSDISGATSTILTLTNVTAAMNGYEYQAVFSNSLGTATTSAATLTVQYAPTVTANPSDQTVMAGQNATFTVAANGNPTPTVQWQSSTDGGKTFTNISGTTSTTLTLNAVTTAMSGYEYQAVFTNSIGSVTTSAATLTVTTTPVAPSITSQPTNQTVTAGQSATFTASASGSPSPTVQWQVSADGGKTFTNITGATNTTLTLNNVTTAMSGYEYEAVFTNTIGSATTRAATLTVNSVPPSPPSPPSPPPAPPVLNVPPLLAFFDSLLGGIETVNGNGTETITDSFLGIPLLVSTFDSHGDLMSVDLFGFVNLTFLFV
jgi:hypothetical protein